MQQRPINKAIREKIETSAQQASESGVVAFDRVYANEQVIDHDLYKLSAATMMKNISWTDRPNLVPVEHCHLYHSIDSNGVTQTTSNSVGGHFHEMKVIPVPGKAPQVICGPPVKFALTNRGGRMVKITERIRGDDHVHDVQYVMSERITMRKPNADFAKVSHGLELQKPADIEGVIG